MERSNKKQETIATQLKKKTKEKEIVEDLMGRGWDEADARLAIKRAKQPQLHEKLPLFYKGVLVFAVLGIFLFLTATIYLSRYALSDPALLQSKSYLYASLAAACITTAILLLLYILYSLAIKHQHPRLHRLFYTAIATIIGTGYAFWFLLILGMIPMSVSMVTFLLIICVAFGISIGVKRRVYDALFYFYDEREKRSVKKTIIVCVASALLLFVVLASVAFFAEQQLVQSSVKSTQSANAQLLAPAREAITQQASNIPNTALRASLLQELSSMPTLEQQDPTQAPLSTQLHDFIDDKPIYTTIDNTADILDSMMRIKNVLSLSKAYYQFKQDEQKELQIALQEHRAIITQQSVSTEELARYNSMLYEKPTINVPKINGVNIELIGSDVLFSIQLKPFTHLVITMRQLLFSDYNSVPTDSMIGAHSGKIFPPLSSVEQLTTDQAEIVRFRVWLYDHRYVLNNM